MSKLNLISKNNNNNLRGKIKPTAGINLNCPIVLAIGFANMILQS
jgi:hypothetical protein